MPSAVFSLQQGGIHQQSARLCVIQSKANYWQIEEILWWFHIKFQLKACSLFRDENGEWRNSISMQTIQDRSERRRFHNSIQRSPCRFKEKQPSSAVRSFSIRRTHVPLVAQHQINTNTKSLSYRKRIMELFVTYIPHELNKMPEEDLYSPMSCCPALILFTSIIIIFPYYCYYFSNITSGSDYNQNNRMKEHV